MYGYNHPPRAVRDVKEYGIPIKMFRVKGSDGRKIAAYRFGDPKKSRFGKFEGRTVLTKELKEKLITKFGCKCAIYCESFNKKELQIDHRIPFEIAGDSAGRVAIDEFMLLCGSANRAKSWSCEHCVNWLEKRDVDICRSCYWAYPEAYTHVALKPIRRLDIIWTGKEVAEYNTLERKAKTLEQDMPNYVKEIIRKALS
jgi:hypothetical protein